MQVLSAAESPVAGDAVASVFLHYHQGPNIDPLQALNRLVNMQLVQSTQQGYYLRDADRWYVASQLTEGASSILGGPDGVHISRHALIKQFADFLPRMGDESIPHQLDQFNLLYNGKDYVAAVEVLKRLEVSLFEQGRYKDLAQYYEQLEGKLEDHKLVHHRVDTLARIYHRLGDLDRAAKKYEEGLKWVRDAGDQIEECHYLANLALCKQESGDLAGTTIYCKAALELLQQIGAGAWEAHIWNIIGETLACLGLIFDAKQASEHALALACDNLQREIEVVARVNLGQHYEELGDFNQAQQECESACRIAQAIGFQLGESAARRNQGILKLNKSKFKLAAEEFNKALKLADITQSVQLQQTIRIELAKTLLFDNKLGDAEATVNEALQYDTPLFSPEAYALRGVILHRQGETGKAVESFYSALEKAQAVVKRTSQYYRGLDVMGLSYSGLTLLENEPYLDEAIEAYQASGFLTHEPGIVRRRLRLFEALAQSDSEKKLAPIRKAIYPEQ